MAKLNKKEFVEAIDTIQDYFAYLDAFDDFLSEFGGASPTEPDVVNQLIHSLNVMFDLKETKEYGSDINYFVYDLQFGRNPYDLKIEDKDGNEIEIENAEQLYDYIISLNGE